MPDRVINAAIDRLDEAVDAQERLVEEVRSLRTSNRRLTAVVGIGLVCLVGVATAMVYAVTASRDVKTAIDRIEVETHVRIFNACVDAVETRDAAQENVDEPFDVNAVPGGAELPETVRVFVQGIVDAGAVQAQQRLTEAQSDVERLTVALGRNPDQGCGTLD